MSGGDLLGGGDEQSRLRSVTNELVRRFDRAKRPIPADEVEAQVNEAISAYADARIVKIAGGSIEVMKHIIGRQMFAQYQKENHDRDPPMPVKRTELIFEVRSFDAVATRVAILASRSELDTNPRTSQHRIRARG